MQRRLQIVPACLTVIVSAIFFIALQQCSAQSPACPLPGDWVFYPAMSDEFTGNEIDSDKWHPNNPGWLGRQPGFFSKDNVKVLDGCLQLTARAEDLPDLPAGFETFTTAAVQSKDRSVYGYYEIRARAMNSGASSAFWFYCIEPHWTTEIDVFEICGKGQKEWDNRYFMTLHVIRTPAEGDKHRESGEHWEAPFRFADDFHTFGLEWNKEELKWYVDGELRRTAPNTDWHQKLTLNFDSETMPEWFGLPDPADLPSTFFVDYVRCWKEKTDFPFTQAIDEYTRRDAEQTPPTGSTMFVGSSTWALWSTIPEDFKTIGGVNRGFGGSTVAQQLEVVDRIVLPYAPKNIVFFCGTNDIAGGTSPAKVFENFKTYTARVWGKCPDCKIFFLASTLAPVREPFWEKQSEYNAMVRDWAAGESRLTYLDSVTALAGPAGRVDEKYFLGDRLHLNDAGQRQLIPIILNAVEQNQ